jgi:hypothetical protein
MVLIRTCRESVAVVLLQEVCMKLPLIAASVFTYTVITMACICYAQLTLA